MARVLIVEDDTSIASMYKFKLQQGGYEVKHAENGEAGLQLAKDFNPQLILLDLRMPVMAGDTMLQELRQHDWGSEMRVIILTNISRAEAPSILRFLNVDRYIIKAHHTPAQVLEIVKEIVKPAGAIK